MKDSADDEVDNDRGSRTHDATTEEVPQDATWELVVQEPVVEDRSDALTTAIVFAVAEAEGISPVDIKLPPLYDVIDAPALEASFFGSDGVSRSRDGESTTEFMYRGYRVVVRSDGWVFVYERVQE